MRHRALDYVCASCKLQTRPPTTLSRTSRRYVQISATPSSSEPLNQSLDAGNGGSSSGADARFEVLGTPSSLLSASISASQTLHTRRGTLVGFNGTPDNAVSTLSLLAPFRRALLGIPFLYQRITSTTPFTALIATKSTVTSLVVVHLDGRLDWMIAQRNALVAWTGHTLKLSPGLNAKMALAHWGSTTATGRGLLTLSGRGLIHQIALKTGESYVVHPSNVVAYSMMQHPPQPYRFAASALRFQIPGLTTWLPSETRFWRTMRETAVWRFLSSTTFAIRTWSRRTIWGDRLFLHFKGPAQILIQSRGSTLSDALTSRDVNEIADSPAGAVSHALAVKPASEDASAAAPSAAPTKMSFASVEGGSVKFEEAKVN
ncbi:hypothetical protein LTR08_000873 [Meristemomyces frigidus]|nr:hypothetical protein LTR08_000873 [Meristemomyces frigidus]